jgi:hypothetical protein
VKLPPRPWGKRRLYHTMNDMLWQNEYMDIMYKLWESSWADDAAMWDVKSGVAFNPAKSRN